MKIISIYFLVFIVQSAEYTWMMCLPKLLMRTRHTVIPVGTLYIIMFYGWWAFTKIHLGWLRFRKKMYYHLLVIFIGAYYLRSRIPNIGRNNLRSFRKGSLKGRLRPRIPFLPSYLRPVAPQLGSRGQHVNIRRAKYITFRPPPQ